MMNVYVLLFRDSGGDQLASRVFSSMPSSLDVREAWVSDMGTLIEAEFRLENKGERNFEVSIYEESVKNPDLWGYLWEEALHHPAGASPSASGLPTMAEIHIQWHRALRGEDTALWAPGDPENPNGHNIGARLTEAEREKYAPQLAVLSRYAQGLDAWGDDLQAKLGARLAPSSRERLLKRQWTSEELRALDVWYELPEAMRDRLVSSFA